jgi:hypothetical protein
MYELLVCGAHVCHTLCQDSPLASVCPECVLLKQLLRLAVNYFPHLLTTGFLSEQL